MQYNFKYNKMPNNNEHLSLEKCKIGNDIFNYWALRSQKDNTFIDIDSDVNNTLSMILSQQNQNQDLQKMLAQSTASNAKSNVDVENLKKQNAMLTQQIAKMQVQNKKG